MSKKSPLKFLLYSLFFWKFLFLSLISPLQARQISPAIVPLGGVITIGNKNYIKITSTGKFMDTQKWQALSNTTMQGWDDCASLATPTGANFTQGPTLIDARDNKQYEIRKFSDGKCWMVDNLMYGGDIDACAGKAVFVADGSPTPSNQFGIGTYGDCGDSRVMGVDPCSIGSKICGYHYSWQAAMQQASAYYNANYTGPTTNVQGLCPEGWRLPTSNIGGDFEILHIAAGSPATGFWQGGSWKGPYSGAYQNTSFYGQGNNGFWWSSTPCSLTRLYDLYLYVSDAFPNHSSTNYYGFTIRCLKD